MTYAEDQKAHKLWIENSIRINEHNAAAERNLAQAVLAAEIANKAALNEAKLTLEPVGTVDVNVSVAWWIM